MVLFDDMDRFLIDYISPAGLQLPMDAANQIDSLIKIYQTKKTLSNWRKSRILPLSRIISYKHYAGAEFP